MTLAGQRGGRTYWLAKWCFMAVPWRRCLTFLRAGQSGGAHCERAFGEDRTGAQDAASGLRASSCRSQGGTKGGRTVRRVWTIRLHSNHRISHLSAEGCNSLWEQELASTRHANAPKPPRRAHTSLGGGRLVRVCRRIFEWLGLLRFCAALPVRLRHQVRGLAQRLLSLAVTLPRAEPMAMESPRDLSRASQWD